MSEPGGARKRPLWVLPVLGVPALLALPLLRGEVLLYRDILHFSLPQQVFAAAALAQGRLPVWTPLVYGGAPFFAEPGTGVLYPPNWLFLLLDPALAATAFVLLHLPVAALGMLLLARACGLSRGAGALAATSYVASGYLLSMHGGHYYFASAALLPLCAALLARAAQQGGARRLVLAAGGVLLLALNGELQGLLLALLLALAVLLDGEGRRRFALLAFAPLLGGALAAVQLLPTALFARGTVRAHGVPLAEAALWSLHPLRLLELIVPQPFGIPWPDNGYWGSAATAGPHHLPWAVSLWLGPSALLLAPLALFGRGRSRALAAAGVLGLWLALGTGTPLFSLWVKLVPLADKFRYPEKYALLATAALVLLGARGLDAVRDDARARRAAQSVFAAAGAAFCAAALWVAQEPAALARAVAAGLIASEANVAPGPALAASARSLTIAGALLLALAFALLLARTRRASLAPLFTLIGAAAGAVNGRALLSYGDAGFLRAPPALLAEVRAAQPAGSTGRVFTDGSCVFRGAGAGTLIERVRRHQWAVGKENFLTVFGVPEALGYGAAESRDQVSIFRALRPAGLLAAERAAGAAVVISCDGAGTPRASPVEGAIPRVRYARPLPAPEDLSARARALLAAPPGTALVAGAVNEQAGSAAPEDSPGAAALIEDRPELVRVRAEGRGGVVVLADAFAPGWSAAVDGAPALLLHADAHFRAVAVAPGAHELVFAYRAPGLREGGALSAGAVLLCAILLWRSRRSQASAE
jgi:hypothetical protein